MKGIVFNIMRFSVNDGPGIRTTIFFKGCPLKCKWCHNPESINPGFEILINEDRCLHCGNCFAICSNNAIYKNGSKYLPIREKCLGCGKCVETCFADARSLIGKEYSYDELLFEILKDKIFFEQSGGGVTFSGGEPFFQSDFLIELLRLCKQNDLHTVVDTSGYTSHINIERAAEFTDLFLYDIKIIDDEEHKKFTGVSNKQIIENLKLLSGLKKQLIIRIPVIPGFNNTIESINDIAKLATSLDIKTIHLLPYHSHGIEKYKRLGRKNFMDFNSIKSIDPIIFKEQLKKFIPEVIVGG